MIEKLRIHNPPIASPLILVPFRGVLLIVEEMSLPSSMMHWRCLFRVGNAAEMMLLSIGGHLPIPIPIFPYY
jgi:hypothetical protein